MLVVFLQAIIRIVMRIYFLLLLLHQCNHLLNERSNGGLRKERDTSIFGATRLKIEIAYAFAILGIESGHTQRSVFFVVRKRPQRDSVGQTTEFIFIMKKMTDVDNINYDHVPI